MTDDEDWNLLLSTPILPLEDLKKLTKNKKCNHFPGCLHLGRKDLLWKALLDKINEFKEEYDIIPKSWLMPYDYKEFVKEKEVRIAY